MRLHIGPVKLDTEERDVRQLLKGYGEVSNLSLHRKELGTTAFAFLDMELDEESWKRMKNRLSGTQWRGLPLRISLPRDDYKSRLRREWETPVEPKPDIKKRKRESDMLIGREKSTQSNRPLKMSVDGKVVTLKDHKAKRIRGGAPTAPPTRMVATFDGCTWKANNGEVLETVRLRESCQSRDRNSTQSPTDQSEVDRFENESDQGTGSLNAASTALKAIFRPTSGRDDDGFRLFSPEPTPEAGGSPPALQQVSASTNGSSNEVSHRTTISQPLFFPHFNSPSLYPQSQFSKLTDREFPLDPEEWRKTWDENVSEWSRWMKRRKRDVVRRFQRGHG